MATIHSAAQNKPVLLTHLLYPKQLSPAVPSAGILPSLLRVGVQVTTVQWCCPAHRKAAPTPQRPRRSGGAPPRGQAAVQAEGTLRPGTLRAPPLSTRVQAVWSLCTEPGLYLMPPLPDTLRCNLPGSSSSTTGLASASPAGNSTCQHSVLTPPCLSALLTNLGIHSSCCSPNAHSLDACALRPKFPKPLKWKEETKFKIRRLLGELEIGGLSKADVTEGHVLMVRPQAGSGTPLSFWTVLEKQRKRLVLLLQ
ncbi:hypothetical protein CB1_000709002 [Camelus ferus]|nr:hypothetical protein CB1_000709002 [Camelus ferus]